MEKIFSICGMCTVRCPIEVHVEGGEILRIQGSGPAGLDGSLCPRGGAGLALLNDHERPQYPMIRVGERGEGKWRQASWDEALTYIADKLTEVVNKHGHRSILMSDRGGPSRICTRLSCGPWARPTTATTTRPAPATCCTPPSPFWACGRKGSVLRPEATARHLVLQTPQHLRGHQRQAKSTACMDAKANGGKLSVIDIRGNDQRLQGRQFLHDPARARTTPSTSP